MRCQVVTQNVLSEFWADDSIVLFQHGLNVWNDWNVWNWSANAVYPHGR